MLRKIGWGTMLLLSVIMYSCYPKGAETVDDTNLVYTTYDEEFNFASERTYFLLDEVISIDTAETISNSTQDIILDEIEKQFAAIGYTRVDSISNPNDVNIVVMSSALTTNVSGVSYYPGYGGWYGGWWGGWGYPGYGYPGGYIPVYYSYDLGSVYIDAFDAQNIDGDDMPPFVWTAGLNGVLNSSGVGFEARVRKLIDQAFKQSSYL
jgi:hypothetical protein